MPLLIAFVVFLFTWTLTTHGKYSATGDEPHYLIVAESLRSDRDLSLANNYRQNDGRLFGQRDLQMELHALPSRRGDVRSIHGLGLPVLILPVYTVAQTVAASTSETLLTRFRMDRGLFAYSIVSLFLIAATSVGIGLLAQGLACVTTRGLAAAIAIIVGISPPVLSHSFLVFPEVVALFTTCAVVWFTTRPSSAADPTIVRCLMAALGVLPWMHQKYVIYAAGLLVVIAWHRRDVMGRLSRRAITGMAMIFLVPQIALAGWLAYEWGSVGGALTTGALAAERVPLTIGSLKSGAMGLWFDRQSGMLAYAPVMWLVPACWWLSWRQTWTFSVPFVLLYLPAAAFVIGWWAGFSPAARYIAPAVPLFTVPVAMGLRYRVVRWAATPLVLLQFTLDGAVWQHPRWLWPAADGNRALNSLGAVGRAYEQLLSPVRTEGVTRQALISVLLAVAATFCLVVAARRQRARAATTAVGA